MTILPNLSAPALAAAVLALGAVAAGPAQAQGDAAQGKRLFARCATCHTIQAGQPARIGPNLYGVVGRKAGSVANFRYSPQLKKSGIVWTEANIDRWITRPNAMVPGTLMAFPGVPNAQERKAIIAYLKKPVP